MAEWKMRCVGLSSDARTNQWKITPACGHPEFKPITTRLALQMVECPKCGLCAVANYNRQAFAIFEDETPAAMPY